MILKIVSGGPVEVPLRWIECDRVALGGFNGGTGLPSSRTVYLEWKDGTGDSVELGEHDRAFVLNNSGKTVDSIRYADN